MNQKFKLLSCVFLCSSTLVAVNHTSAQSVSVSTMMDQIQVLESTDKTYMLLISKPTLVNQAAYQDVKAVNAFFLSHDGIMDCSYSWNVGDFKLTLERSKAKDILRNVFLFDDAFINSKF